MIDGQLKVGRAEILVDAVRGGRLASLRIDGRELLVLDPNRGGMQWGSYPMVPWAGRIRDGRFSFGDQQIQLPLNMPPHAIHGVGFVSPWARTGSDTITCGLGDPWPFGGTATQRFELDEEGLTISMSVTAEVDMPVMIGWHPWFARYLPDRTGRPVEAVLGFGPSRMYELDDVAIPTGKLVTPSEGPWDNCFRDLEANPTIDWPGLLTLELTSSCDHWVIYTEPAEALCVEPQTSAPDVFNRPELSESVVLAGEEFSAWFRIAWS